MWLSLTSQQQDRTQETNQATRAGGEESRESCSSSTEGTEGYIRGRGGKQSYAQCSYPICYVFTFQGNFTDIVSSNTMKSVAPKSRNYASTKTRIPTLINFKLLQIYGTSSKNIETLSQASTSKMSNVGSEAEYTPNVWLVPSWSSTMSARRVSRYK